MSRPDISIVVPARNEAASLPALLAELGHHLDGLSFEVLVIDDGSTDATRDALTSERERSSYDLRHIRHDRPAGKSIALRTGAFAARGTIVVTVDGDGQNDPKFIKPLINALRDGGPNTGIAAGQRLKRGDGRIKLVASRIANGLRRRVLHDSTRDTACGLKALHTDVMRKLPFFDGCHRFLPALVLQEGYEVVHIDVEDRPRRHGKSHYGILDRGMQGIADLLGVWWLRRRRRFVPKIEEISEGQVRGSSL